jgi:hypothetical protein
MEKMRERKVRSVTARLAGGAALAAFALGLTAVMLALPAAAQEKKPNILFIMGDDIGWMQPSYYHRGLMVGETPNIDRIGREGMAFTDYYAMQSCTSGRNAFFTGMYPLRTGMIPPQLPGSPSWLRPGTPAVAQFLYDLGYTTVSSVRTISATTRSRCRRRTAFRSTGATSITWTRCNR